MCIFSKYLKPLDTQRVNERGVMTLARLLFTPPNRGQLS